MKPETNEVPVKLEDAMRRLDEVVAALDSEQADLEQALKLYEEGVRLVRICHERLQDAERTVRILKLNPDGEIAEVPMQAE
ncbi:MAG: exodeoxyribonuclease VII small subunit [Clostridia bacterium]|nr:exodeoxyribonuclease VII small subunit [Clostridia bacterium]